VSVFAPSSFYSTDLVRAPIELPTMHLPSSDPYSPLLRSEERKLFALCPTLYAHRAKNAFPFLLKGPQPLSEDPISSQQYRQYQSNADKWVPCKRSVDAERDDIAYYLGNLDRCLKSTGVGFGGNGYSTVINFLSETLPPMDPACRIVTVIPVLNEEAIIQRTLEEYSHQTLLPSQHELLIVLLNRPGIQKDATEGLITEWQLNNPEAKVTKVSLELPSPFGGGGFGRRIGADITMTRSLARRRQVGPLYIACDDADCTNIPPYLLESIVTEFDTHSHLDCIRRVVTRDPLVLADHDLLRFEHMVNRLTEAYFFRKMGRDLKLSQFVPYSERRVTDAQFWLRTLTAGGDMALSAQALALISGGFEPVGQRSDLPQGVKLSLLRGRALHSGIELSNISVKRISVRSAQDSRRNQQHLLKRLHFRNNKSAYSSFTDIQDLELMRNPEERERRLSSKVYQRFARFTSINDKELVDTANSLIDYYTTKFFPYLFPNSESNVAEVYASFLSTYLVGKKGAFQQRDKRVSLTDPSALRDQASRYRDAFDRGIFRFQKSDLP
jgi:hypothetical protein